MLNYINTKEDRGNFGIEFRINERGQAEIGQISVLGPESMKEARQGGRPNFGTGSESTNQGRQTGTRALSIIIIIIFFNLVLWSWD